MHFSRAKSWLHCGVANCLIQLLPCGVFVAVSTLTSISLHFFLVSLLFLCLCFWQARINARALLSPFHLIIPVNYAKLPTKTLHIKLTHRGEKKKRKALVALILWLELCAFFLHRFTPLNPRFTLQLLISQSAASSCCILMSNWQWLTAL